MNKTDSDSVLEGLVHELIAEHKCHTVLLYGSRARGDATAKSDYDLAGVRKGGKQFRIAEKRGAIFLDIFIFPDSHFKKVESHHLYLKDAIVLAQKNGFGSRFLKSVKKLVKKRQAPLPPDEIRARQIWAHKMLERSKEGDIEGNYRRSWLHEALLTDYFAIRKKSYWGSKESFSWLKKNDQKTYKLFETVLRQPTNLIALKKLVERVTKLKTS